MKKTLSITWDQLHRDCCVLASHLTDHPWHGIIAITRGGLIPAAIVATELDIRVIDTICISSYKSDVQDVPEVLKSISLAGSKNWLLIDDLVDSGQTARVARDLLPEAYFATLYAKPDGKEMVDTFIAEVSQDTWVVFPWEADLPKGPWEA